MKEKVQWCWTNAPNTFPLTSTMADLIQIGPRADLKVKFEGGGWVYLWAEVDTSDDSIHHWEVDGREFTTFQDALMAVAK